MPNSSGSSAARSKIRILAAVMAVDSRLMTDSLDIFFRHEAAMRSEIVFTAISLATSPALAPPMPSHTTAKQESLSGQAAMQLS